jgi:hypothetical protein
VYLGRFRRPSRKEIRMKIRYGHVSNSSSSSFVIAYTELPKFDEETIQKYPVLTYINSLIEEAFKGLIISSIEEWDTHIVEKYSWSDAQTIEAILTSGEFRQELYDEVITYLKKGYKIFLRTVDWCEDASINDLLPKMHDGENIILIQGER